MKPSGKTNNAMGLTHIIEARQRKDGLSPDEVDQLLHRIVTTIAHGEEIRRFDFSGASNVVIAHQGVEAVLVKQKGSNAWLLSGWTQKNPDASRAGYVASGATSAAPTTAQRGSVAGSGSIVDDGDIDVKRSESGAIQGFYDPATGKSFLIADNLTAEAAPAVLLHEVGIHMSSDGSLDQVFKRAQFLLGNVQGNPFIDRVRERLSVLIGKTR